MNKSLLVYFLLLLFSSSCFSFEKEIPLQFKTLKALPKVNSRILCDSCQDLPDTTEVIFHSVTKPLELKEICTMDIYRSSIFCQNQGD
ncbi:hypothetical protein DFP76_105145 [Marinomonas aquiplantarum]|uniref:Lipoprotein n=1 Tax=Marinomonas aquiplantarum TaxID=491951 RepID=A0A366CZN2_9GAMM|nr:hypothetical protein DFP76_105145 [Marinomonas aquiplantarum]